MEETTPAGSPRATSASALSPGRDLVAIAGGPPVWLTWGMSRPAWLRTHQSNPGDWYVSLVDTGSNVEIARLIGPRWICTAVAWSSDGKRIAAASADHRVYVWDVRTHALVAKTRLLAVPIALSWCEAWRVVARCADRSVRILDVVPSPPLAEVKDHARHADPSEG